MRRDYGEAYRVESIDGVAEVFKQSLPLFQEHYDFSLDEVKENPPSFSSASPEDLGILAPLIEDRAFGLLAQYDGNPTFIYNPEAEEPVWEPEVAGAVLTYLRTELGGGHDATRSDQLQQDLEDETVNNIVSYVGQRIYGEELGFEYSEPNADIDEAEVLGSRSLPDAAADDWRRVFNDMPEPLKMLSGDVADIQTDIAAVAGSVVGYRAFEDLERDNILDMTNEEIRRKYGALELEDELIGKAFPNV